MTSGYANLFAKPFAGFSGTLGIRQDQHSSFGGATSFAASGVYSPNKGRSRLRANYSEGFKAPTPFQLGSEFGNPNLAPEDSKGWEVGGDQQLWGEALSIGATYFRRTTRNQIDFNFCPSDNSLCDDGRFGFYDNVARTRSTGVELLVSARPVEGLSIDASYTHLNPRNKAADSPNAGNVLVRRPQETFSLSADYRHRSGLAGGVTVTTASDRFIDAANTRRLDGYTTLDLRASYEFYQGLELYGRFDNVLDAQYETVDQYGTFGRAGFIGLRAAL
ncbi:TonB-dependent receptor [Hankyongella ginsenosidimutans]|uniref:TonB-dependent receptor n=1 Tax=Hankyongella ginsenosidimutans TaxID=1763828 RepID=UPI00319E11B6